MLVAVEAIPTPKNPKTTQTVRAHDLCNKYIGIAAPKHLSQRKQRPRRPCCPCGFRRQAHHVSFDPREIGGDLRLECRQAPHERDDFGHVAIVFVVGQFRADPDWVPYIAQHTSNMLAKSLIVDCYC